MCVTVSNLKIFHNIKIPMKKLKNSLICETLTWNDGTRCRADVYFFYDLDGSRKEGKLGALRSTLLEVSCYKESGFGHVE